MLKRCRHKTAKVERHEREKDATKGDPSIRKIRIESIAPNFGGPEGPLGEGL